MNKEIISNKQGVPLICMFIIGNALILSPGTDVGKDIWIAMLLGMVMVIPLLFIYSRIIKVVPGQDLYDLQKYSLGKFFGSITTIIYIWFCFHMGAMILRSFSEFIQSVSFPETPQYVTLVLLGVLCILGAKCGIEVLARWAAFTFPAILCVILFLVIFSLPKGELSNLKPLLFDGFNPVFKTSFGLLTFPFAEVFLFTTIFNSLQDKTKTFRIFFLGILIAASLLVLVTVRNIAVLGPENMSRLYFPPYVAVSVISIASFFDRFEIYVAAIFVVSGFLKATICLYAASKGLSKLFKVDGYEKFVAPLGILMFTVANFIFKNLFEMFDWIEDVYKYYAFPFLVALPLLVLIIAEIKSRVVKNKPAPAK